MLKWDSVSKIAPDAPIKAEITMDPLPLSVNQRQLQLIQQEIGQAIASLQDKHQSGQFAPDQDREREQNLATYGTTNYEEAHSLVQSMDDQVKSYLQAWQDVPEASKAIAIDLNSYQVSILRRSLEQGCSRADAETKPLLEDVIEQLPEHSPQENAD